MTHPTDELTRLLTGAADDIVERDRVLAPDAPRLWRRGRRTTWGGRAATAGIAAFVLFLVVTGGVALTGIGPTVPAVGGTVTYPEVVSDMFVDQHPAGGGPVFGLVRAVPTSSQPDDLLAIQRRGSLAGLQDRGSSTGPITLADGGTPVLAPDGQRALTSEGVVVLDGDSVVAPVVTFPETPARTGVHDAWSPDSQHVLLSTVAGPAVTNGYAAVELSPGPGDQDVLAAGWRGNDTVLGVRSTTGGGLDLVAHGLTEPRWSKVASVTADVVAVPVGSAGPVTPERAFASPDGSRLLLVYPAGAGPARSVLVDATTGARVPFAGETPTTTIAWDSCDPVWQSGQPLLADGGLRRPATGESVLRFSGHRPAGCVSLAGNELTGSPAPGAAGAWKEWAWQLWTAALPVGGVLLVGWTVWMLVALRRSKKHGEDFLPMMLGRLF